MPKKSAFRARRYAAKCPNGEKFAIQSAQTRRDAPQWRKIRYSERTDAQRRPPMAKNSPFRAHRRAVTRPNGEKFAIQSAQTRPNGEKFAIQSAQTRRDAPQWRKIRHSPPGGQPRPHTFLYFSYNLLPFS